MNLFYGPTCAKTEYLLLLVLVAGKQHFTSTVEVVENVLKLNCEEFDNPGQFPNTTDNKTVTEKCFYSFPSVFDFLTNC